MAFFQGGKDSVVVPEQTRSMAEALRANGQQPLVRLYPEEGHGFRKAVNHADMLSRLAAFYSRCCCARCQSFYQLSYGGITLTTTNLLLDFRVLANFTLFVITKSKTAATRSLADC